MQLRDFVFTLNNPKITKETFIEDIHTKIKIKYIIVGLEEGELTHTPHFQGFIQLEGRIRWLKLSKLYEWHIEQRKGSVEECIAYCKKEENFIESGIPKPESSLKNSNKERYQELLTLAQSGQMDELKIKYPGEYIRHHRNLHAVHVEAMKASSNEKICLWLVGEPGSGKSRFAQDFDQDAYWKNPNKWWDGFQNNKTVIIDDFSTEHKVLGYHLKRWGDRYPILGETKGSSLYINYNVLIITSNYTIEEIWPEDKILQEALKRRFHVHKVMGYDINPEGLVSLTVCKPGSVDYIFDQTKTINKFNFI